MITSFFTCDRCKAKYAEQTSIPSADSYPISIGVAITTGVHRPNYYTPSLKLETTWCRKCVEEINLFARSHATPNDADKPPSPPSIEQRIIDILSDLGFQPNS